MSTTALDYSNSIPLRRSAIVRWSMVLTLGFLLISSVILVAISLAKVDLSSNTASNVIAISNPIAPEAGIRAFAEATATPAPNPVVIAIQAPMPPSDR